MTDVPSPPPPAPLKLSVVIPAYNEQATVQELVRRVVAARLPGGMTREIVCGSRFFSGDPHRVLYFWHTLGNRVITFLSNMFTNLNLTDVEVCYKAFRRDVLQRISPLKCGGFGFEVEVTAKVAKLSPPVRIFEVGIAYYGRSYEEGKKITWRDGIKAILAIIRFRFSD